LKNPLVELYEDGKQRISHRLTLISLVLQQAGVFDDACHWDLNLSPL
jgi:hypothetical protein